MFVANENPTACKKNKVEQINKTKFHCLLGPKWLLVSVLILQFVSFFFSPKKCNLFHYHLILCVCLIIAAHSTLKHPLCCYEKYKQTEKKEKQKSKLIYQRTKRKQCFSSPLRDFYVNVLLFYYFSNSVKCSRSWQMWLCTLYLYRIWFGLNQVTILLVFHPITQSH